MNGDLRLRVTPGVDVWVPAADAHPVAAAGVMRPVVGSVTLTPRPDRVTVRIPVSERVPFQVTETERTLTLTLYGAVGDVNWIRYGSPDTLIRSVAWAQGSDRTVTLTVELGQALWGFHTRWDRGDLLLDIRRPPAIDAGDPLRNRFIVVDPGHPPIGATGPTGFREAQANLGVALILRDLLQAAGARVLMTRTSDSAVDLYPRTKLADTANAELLISIHNNALPDGVNPFTNNGTSVFYNHPRSIPLAMAVDRALVNRLGLRDLGVGRGDLALVRPTWMPAILAEGLFMMLPDQEAALRSPEGQRLYAQGVFDGIRQFLRDRARGTLGRTVAAGRRRASPDSVPQGHCDALASLHPIRADLPRRRGAAPSAASAARRAGPGRPCRPRSPPRFTGEHPRLHAAPGPGAAHDRPGPRRPQQRRPPPPPRLRLAPAGRDRRAFAL